MAERKHDLRVTDRAVFTDELMDDLRSKHAGDRGEPIVQQSALGFAPIGAHRFAGGEQSALASLDVREFVQARRGGGSIPDDGTRWLRLPRFVPLLRKYGCLPRS